MHKYIQNTKERFRRRTERRIDANHEENSDYTIQTSQIYSKEVLDSMVKNSHESIFFKSNPNSSSQKKSLDTL